MICWLKKNLLIKAEFNFNSLDQDNKIFYYLRQVLLI